MTARWHNTANERVIHHGTDRWARAWAVVSGPIGLVCFSTTDFGGGGTLPPWVRSGRKATAIRQMNNVPASQARPPKLKFGASAGRLTSARSTRHRTIK